MLNSVDLNRLCHIMFYDLTTNKLYESLDDIEQRQYQFIKDGCVVNIEKIKRMIEKGELRLARPIIARRKIIGSGTDQYSWQDFKEIEDSLDEEDRQEFNHNKSIIFEEKRKFKYVSMRQQHEGVSIQRKEIIENKFLRQKSLVEDLGEGEQLQHLVINWREIFRKLARKSV